MKKQHYEHEQQHLSLHRRSSARSAFVRPMLELLGTIDQVTSGTQGGNVDALIGGTGGFQPTPPPPDRS